jgi:hypothetical protein
MGLDPDRYSAKNAGSGSGLNESGSETLTASVPVPYLTALLAKTS